MHTGLKTGAHYGKEFLISYEIHGIIIKGEIVQRRSFVARAIPGSRILQHSQILKTVPEIGLNGAQACETH